MAEGKRSVLGRVFGFIWSLFVFAYRFVLVATVLVLAVALWFGMSGGAPKPIENNVALVIWPSGAVVDVFDQDPTSAFFENVSGMPPSQTLLRDMIEALELGATDPRISLAVLKLDDMTSIGLAQMQEMAAAMKTFRDADKPIWVYGAFFDQRSYYLAAQADHIIVDPEGLVLLEGFAYYGNYYKEALDKLGVNVHVFRVGEYKAAVEPFIRNDMSPEARRANLDWLGDLWAQYGHDVGEARRLGDGAVDAYVAGFVQQLVAARGHSAQVALSAQLATDIKTLSEYRAAIAETVGFDDDGVSFRQVHFEQYLRAARQHQLSTSHHQQIALVAVQGEIVDGVGEVGQAGGDRIAEMLAEVRRDDAVKAVVLRVDSPGGSAWASEKIRREVRALREADKPVVVSMGNMAASGGYWVSMDANQIWANATTITGSIGIFGLIPTLEEPLAKLGIHTDGVGTTALAGQMRIDRALSEPVKQIYQSMIEHGYRQFIEGAAAGRMKTVEEIEALAQGRVWSGIDAQKSGLVDRLGGLQQAIDSAAAMAGLADGEWSLYEVEAADDNPLKALGGLFSQASIDIDWLPGGNVWLKGWLVQQAQSVPALTLNDPRGVYAFCFCEFDPSGGQVGR